MQITVKTTQNKIHKVDVEPTETVGQLKAKIEAAHGYPAATQKVIYSGKILPDDKTIESCGVKEKDFFVLMPKPTPTPKPQVPSTSAAAESAPVTTPAAPTTPVATTTSDEPSTPAAPAAVQGAPSSTTASSDSGNNGGFLTGEALQSAITNMVEMGFPRDQVLRALRASFNNPDRAVEYLMNGIPAHLEAEAARPAAQPSTAPSNPPATQAPQSTPAPAVPAAQTPSAQTSNQPQNLFQLAQQQQQRGSTGAGATGGGLDLGALQGGGGGGGGGQMPNLSNLREAVAQNPQLAQLLIQQLAQSNPALAQHLANNPDLLLQALGGMEGEDGEDGEGGPLPPGAQVVSVTEEERAAIQRLEALGFPRQAVIEAYFACDKNEELAANYLFDSSNFED
ncbi:hypothetical protein D9756_005226 [Leucocoprinus leucothites]|uniref:UV excision repair protein RAD23 n=1 Tax=Leucocoprinus leucothites TaxID=201217 RepID=A0A8H5D860_9AGAR|nr:hypothetical protein D9756_005226 [Leucoagaricus leucothites]